MTTKRNQSMSFGNEAEIFNEARKAFVKAAQRRKVVLTAQLSTIREEIAALDTSLRQSVEQVVPSHRRNDTSRTGTIRRFFQANRTARIGKRMVIEGVNTMRTRDGLCPIKDSYLGIILSKLKTEGFLANPAYGVWQIVN